MSAIKSQRGKESWEMLSDPTLKISHRLKVLKALGYILKSQLDDYF